MKVFIANFGRQNYEWPECLARGTIATMNEVSAQAYWEKGDREGYIESRMKGKTWAGIAPTKPVASRWFNLMTIVSQSSGDIWIHREREQCWWTTSRNDPPSFEAKVEPVGDKRSVIVCHKACDPWSNRDKNGKRLEWADIHPKAQEFLFTESTLQQLRDDNAEYALALIEGVDLSPWHKRASWKSKFEKAFKNHGAVTKFDAKQRAAVRMAMTAHETAAGANGQRVMRTVKNKELMFDSQHNLEKYLMSLIDLQEGLCAITGLALQYDGKHEDSEMLCSLDRIDSDGHYEAGNLQIVCRFINRWKSDASDEEFRRLIGVVRSTGSL